jgi:hypothetical protein
MKDVTSEQIDDVLAEIEKFMHENGGHMTIDFTEATSAKDAIKEIKQTNSLECAGNNMACKVPTLMEGLDGK